MVGDPSELFLGFLCVVWSSFIFCQVGERALVPLRGLFSPFPAESSAQGCIPALCPDPIPLFRQFVRELELFLKSRQGQSRVEPCQGAGSGHHQGLLWELAQPQPWECPRFCLTPQNLWEFAQGRSCPSSTEQLQSSDIRNDTWELPSRARGQILELLPGWGRQRFREGWKGNDFGRVMIFGGLGWVMILGG